MKKIVINFDNGETHKLPNLCSSQLGTDVFLCARFDEEVTKSVLTSLELFLLEKGFTVNDLRSIEFVKV